MTTNNELREGDTVRILGKLRKKNPHAGKVGPIVKIVQDRTETLYFVDVPGVEGPRYLRLIIYLRDEIERVESEVQSG